ncbi:uncharacterized protein LOC108717872 isoform X2 [Xenopus laevis]|uniref:Uncharacterized protein LOC108717872 isoform X2 n=1 Tax=Xenopus laevis TaxID=8355 RepID=A0A8J0VFB3_XENLA|nr:uncharacterized protein LOC108717872 isoform X2 [Xenopus laevis]
MATNLSYKISSLPSVLDHYKNKNEDVQKKEIKKRKPTNAIKTFDDDQDDEEKTKKEFLEKRHLETYEGLYSLRNTLYLKYINLLRKKVQKQHSEMQKWHKAPVKQQNTGDLKKIISLENELAKSGILKNKIDHEHFHQLIHPNMGNLKETLQDIKSKVTSTKSFTSLHIRKPTIMLERRTKEQRQTIKNSVPVTGHLPNKEKKTNKETNDILPKLPLTELLIRPEVEYEKTAQKFTRNFSPRESHIYKEHVIQMYSLSLCNMAYSRSLMEKSGLFSDFEDESNIHDLLKNLCQGEDEHADVLQKKVKMTKSSDGQHKKTLKCKRNRESSKASALDETEVKHNNDSFDHSLENQKVIVQEKEPLSIEEARANYPLLEAKTIKYWTNYIYS